MEYFTLYQRLYEATRQAGIVAQMLQKDIVNEGKEVLKTKGEDAYHLAMRQAKTRADEIVQELLLSSLLPEYKEILSVDAEEETTLLNEYTNTSYAYTLVLDPIDGTLDYLHQKDTYSICSAILHANDMKMALVYFPARKKAYGYCEGMGTFIYHDPIQTPWNQGEVLDIQPHPCKPNIIYKNSRLSKAIVSQLEAKGFMVMDDQHNHMGCPDAIIECLYGRGLAYFSDTRNIRDILMGAILGKMNKGHFFDYKGNETTWQSHGRQKEIVFTIYDKEDIF